MDFDEYDYLEKAVEPSEPLIVSNGADYAVRMKGVEDRHMLYDRSRTSTLPENATERRHRNDRHKLKDGSKKRRVSEDAADGSQRDGYWSEKGQKQEHKRSSHDMERVEYDNQDREKRDKDWNVRDRDWERRGGWRNGGGWGGGGRERFLGRNPDFSRFGGRARERKARHSDKEVEKEYRSADRDKELRGSRYSREKKENKEEAVSTEPEVDPERDQRTVFAFQISLKADGRDVYDFFSKAGKVRDVRLIMDRKLRRSKGFGYVEFYDAMSVPMAIAMTGQLLLRQPVVVKPAEPEKNLVQSTAGATGAGGAMGPYSGGARRLYVGNLHYNITDFQLRQVFEPFGPVELVQLPLDSVTGQNKGYAFIQFARLEDAGCAQASLNGTLELAGRVMKVL